MLIENFYYLKSLYIIIHYFQLYSHFAEPHSLWEAQLAILQLSNHDDRELVNQIWENIMLKGIVLCTFIQL